MAQNIHSMTHNDPLWPRMIQIIHSMTHYDPKPSKLFYNNSNKSLGPFIFLNFVPKILFMGKCGTETWKCFVQNKTRFKSVFKDADFEFDNCVRKFRTWN